MEWGHCDVVRFGECGDATYLRDAMPRDIGTQHIDRVAAQQILKDAVFGGEAPETDRRHALTRDTIRATKVRERAGLVEPEQVQTLEGGGETGCIAGSESAGSVQDKVATWTSSGTH